MPDLFTLGELASLMQVAQLDTASATLARDLATTRIRTAAGAARYDLLTDLSPLKPTALEVARRILANPDALRSLTIGGVTETYEPAGGGSSSLLTEAEVREVHQLVGHGGAFSIRPGPYRTGRIRAW